MRIILTGPTAVGKTEISIQLARTLNVPIISADSRQCYKYMDIGTGKISENWLQQIRHYNISIFTPDIDDNAQAFLFRCRDWEQEILQHHAHLLYAGGSTLYVESLLRPFDEVPKSSAKNLEKLKDREKEFGLESLFYNLREVDPVYAEKMDGMNRQRIFRALDVFMQTGRPFSSFHHRNEPVKPPPDTLVFVLNRDRKVLHQRINERVDNMIRDGLINEVQKLLEMGFAPTLNALQTVGYREIISCLEGNISMNQAVSLIKRNTRRYARRQLTWFRRWEVVFWLLLDSMETEEVVRQIINRMNEVAAKQNMR